jgi:hypothetical protein
MIGWTLHLLILNVNTVSIKAGNFSSVGKATCYGLDDTEVGVRVPGRVKNFLFFTSSRPALGSTQPPIQWIPGALSPVLKWPELEADHSPPTSAEVKKM